jgi:hypothetical protein
VHSVFGAYALAATLVASPVGAAARSKFEPPVMSWQAKPARCDVTAYFASVGMGIDQVARGRIEALLEGDPAVVRVRPYSRGREGETLLCIRLRLKSEARPLFRRLRALVPPGPRGYPITIETKDGIRFSRY